MNSHVETLAKHGIILPEEARLTVIGEHHTDCPKPYCKKARTESYNDPLKVQIDSDYVFWKCAHCFWSGHIGQKPSAHQNLLGEDQSFVKLSYGFDKIPDGADRMILVMRDIDAALLIRLGFENVVSVPDTPRDIQKQDNFWYLSENASKIQKIKKIIFAFDETDHGMWLRQELSRRIGSLS